MRNLRPALYALVGLLVVGVITWLATPRLTVKNLAEGTTIRLDGHAHSASKTKASFWVAPGSHDLQIESEDHLTKRERLSLSIFSHPSIDGHLSTFAEELAKREPLARYLPEDSTGHFRIDYRADASYHTTYVITLIAILNSPNQQAQYLADLRAHKAEALAWIRSRHVDPAKLKIEWKPAEAANL